MLNISAEKWKSLKIRIDAEKGTAKTGTPNQLLLTHALPMNCLYRGTAKLSFIFCRYQQL